MMLSANAENLASLVITQAAEPGAPHIYGSDSSPMDLRTGAINYGAPEFGILSCGMAQMARRYDLPSMTGGFSGFSIADDGRVRMCDYLSTCFSSACHPDITGGLGSIDDAKGICFKQLLIDALTWECCREYMRPIEITDERLGLDAIKEIDPRGNFLAHPHTRKYLRNELIFWDEEKYEFLGMERTAQRERAGELVNEILAEHRVTPLDESIVRKAYEIIEAYEREYAK
jgi:trimethylamine--corrinoid protein Co-methyltransferase